MKIHALLTVFVVLLATRDGLTVEWEGASLLARDPHILASHSSDRTLRNIEQIGANTVGINVAWFQDEISSNEIAPNYDTWSATFSSIGHAIDRAHDLGLQVMLKPFAEVQQPVGSEPWRATIQPTDPDAWFESYGAFISQFAEFAQTKDVALFAVGTEMNSMERYTDQWRDIITDVRQQYDGKLTYSANFSPTEVGGVPDVGGYQAVEWWDDLDYVGISAYFGLTSVPNPTYEQIATGWERNASEISDWLTRTRLTQKVIFTEVGYRSHPDGASYHNPNLDERVDLGVQKRAYEAMFDVLGDAEWFGGAFPWAWETNANAGGPNDGSLNVQNKPAEKVLARNYGGRHPVQYYPQLLSSWELNVDERLDEWADVHPESAGDFDDVLALSNVHATHGNHSLAISSVGGPAQSHNSAATTWSIHNRREQFSTLRNAFSKSGKFDLRMDISFRGEDLPEDLSYFDVRIAMQGNGWVQSDTLAFATSNQDASHSVSVPLSTFDGAVWDLENLDSLQFHITNYTSAGESVTYYVDNLRLVSKVPGDVSNDGELNATDINAILEAVHKEEWVSQFDVNQDGVLNEEDRDQWLLNVGWSLVDINRDDAVSLADLLQFREHFGADGAGWEMGDFDGDATVGFDDFLTLARSYDDQSPTSASTVPEPCAELSFMIALAVLVLTTVRTRSSRV